jgi:hypothetical protein
VADGRGDGSMQRPVGGFAALTANRDNARSRDPASPPARRPASSPRLRECPMSTQKILYTLTDEAPYLATQSLLPIVEAFA